MSRTTTPRHVLCVSNEGYAASLIVRRVYPVLPDADGEQRGLVRIVDESGEDYLFPMSLFVAIELPAPARRALRAAPTAPAPRRATGGRRR